MKNNKLIYFLLNSNFLCLILSNPFSILDTTGSTYTPVANIDYLNKGGDSLISVPIVDEIKIFYSHLNGNNYELYTWTDLEINDPKPPTPAGTFPNAIALAPAPRSLNYLFGSAYTANNYGKVYVWSGEFASWSTQQVLQAPSYIDYVNSYYGSSIAFDQDDYSTLYVGCGNCSSLGGKRHGTIFTYDQTPDGPKTRAENLFVYDHLTRTKVNTWSQNQAIYFTTLYNLGMEKITVNKNLILADVYRTEYNTAAPTSNIKKALLMRRTPDKTIVPEQLLSIGTLSLSDFGVYDDTIVLAVQSQTVTSFANAGAVYILAPGPPGKPGPGKRAPIQWSLQQILYAPTPAASQFFGKAISIDGKRLSVLDTSTQSSYLFEKGGPRGTWSLQQRLVLNGAAGSQVILRDDTMVVSTANNLHSIYNTFSTADCLILSIEDQFGDGWDLARLVITYPDGSQDFLQSRCLIDDPNRIRFCPRHIEDEGIYKLEVIDAKKSKNYWEILWRVYNEYSGTWIIANWDTKLEYSWDTTFNRFVPRKIEKTLPNNITCKVCPTKPTDKPTPVLRNRHLKGNDNANNGGTVHPTISPAPTLATTSGVNWRVMQLIGDGWFENDHQGASYYVSDAKSRKLIAVGTLCDWEASGKVCWLDLPDGEYNIRVGGALTVSTSTLRWKFCSNLNPYVAQSQVVVKISDGECKIIGYHKLTAFCGLTDPAVPAAIEFVILGAAMSSGELSSYDKSSLIQAIVFSLPGVTTNDVIIDSVSEGNSVGLFVRAIVTFRQSKTGYDLLNAEGIDNLLYSLENYMPDSGTRAIWSGLQSAEFKNIFHSSTGVQYVSIEILGSDDIPLTIPAEVDQVVNYIETPTQNYVENTQIHTIDVINLFSISGYLVTLFSILGFIISFVAYIRHKPNHINKNKKSSKSSLLNLKDTKDLSTTLSEYEEINISEHLIDNNHNGIGNDGNDGDEIESIGSITSEDEYSERSDCENLNKKSKSSKSKSKSTKKSKTTKKTKKSHDKEIN